MKTVLAIFVCLALVALGFFWFSGATPALKLAAPVTVVGSSTPVTVQADDPHGLKSFTAEIRQGGQSKVVLADKTRSKKTERVFDFSVGGKQAPFLNEGPATLVFTAKSNDFRGSSTTLTQDVTVSLRPPTIVADGRQHTLIRAAPS